MPWFPKTLLLASDKVPVIGVSSRPQPCLLHEKALRSLNDLPPFSPILTKLLALLASEDPSFRELAGVIEKDTVLAGNILRLVNSGMYGRRATITSVAHAVAILGQVKLRNAALGLSAGRMWQKLKFAQGFSIGRFNQHSLGVALACDQIAMRVPMDYPEGAFVAGLFHDIGKLLLATALTHEYELIEELMQGSESRDSTVRAQAEREVMGTTSAELSASALEKWNLPKPVVDAVRRQQEVVPLSDGPVALARALQVSDSLAIQLGAGLHTTDEDLMEPDVSALEEIGVQAPYELCDQFRQEFDLLRAVA